MLSRLRYAGSPGGMQYDEKNIRRRVYDALNVLMAMGIISRERKEIFWKGLPQGPQLSLDRLRGEKQRLCQQLNNQRQYIAVGNPPPTPNSLFPPPFSSSSPFPESESGGQFLVSTQTAKHVTSTCFKGKYIRCLHSLLFLTPYFFPRFPIYIFSNLSISYFTSIFSRTSFIWKVPFSSPILLRCRIGGKLALLCCAVSAFTCFGLMLASGSVLLVTFLLCRNWLNSK